MINKEKTYKIYAHINKINHKIYIGQTSRKNPNERWRYGKGYKHCPHFYNAIQKYGWDNFEHIILFDNISGFEIADILEVELIKKFHTNNNNYGYNSASGGSFGRTLSKETKEKIRQSKIGNKNPNFNKKAKEITKERLSHSHKGIIQTPEWINKRKCCNSANGMYYKSHNIITRQKISEKLRGGKNPSSKKCFIFSNVKDIKEIECLSYAYKETSMGTKYCRIHRLSGIKKKNSNEIFFILTLDEYFKFLTYCNENNLPLNTIQQRYDAYNKFFIVKDYYIQNETKCEAEEKVKQIIENSKYIIGGDKT